MAKRLIYLTHWRFPSEKTMTPLIMRTCEGFAKEGFEVELWIPARHNPMFRGVDPFEQHHVETRFPIKRTFTIDLIRFSFLGSATFFLMVTSFALGAAVHLLFANRKNTILYAHDVRDVYFLSWLGFPIYVEMHDFYESSLSFINRQVLAHASGLIVTNSIKKKYLNKKYGFPLERMLHQPNAVNYDFFHIGTSREEARKELNLPHDKLLILYTGHLFSWKGVDTLALSATHIPGNALIYFVGGTQKDREVLQTLVKERSLPRIEFLPHQDHARIPLFQKAADVLVLPNTAREEASKYETSPVKLFEYMSSETPIVASDLPSIRDIVSDDEVCFFEPDDPKSLGEAIGDVLTDPVRARERALKASQQAKGLSWEARAADISHLIRRTS